MMAHPDDPEFVAGGTVLLADGLEPHTVEQVYLASINSLNCWDEITATLDAKIDSP